MLAYNKGKRMLPGGKPMKLNERGRAKYRPLTEYEENDVKNVLFEKIQEETNRIFETDDTAFFLISNAQQKHIV